MAHTGRDPDRLRGLRTLLGSRGRGASNAASADAVVRQGLTVTLRLPTDIEPDLERIAVATEQRCGVRPALDRNFLGGALRFEPDPGSPASNQIVVDITTGEFGEHAMTEWEIRMSDWTEIRDVLTAAPFQRAVMEDFGSDLLRQDRFRLFHATLASTVEVMHPLALEWSLRFVSPERYLAALGDPEAEFGVMVHVRLVRIEDADDEFVMDSYGMGVFGLPDVQMRFTRLDPSTVGPWLKSVAYYLYEHGEVIGENDWVDGLIGDTRFYCHRRHSYVPLQRQVIDIDAGRYAPSPGPKFAR